MNKIRLGCGDSECPICENIPEESELPIRKPVCIISDYENLIPSKWLTMKNQLIDWAKHVGVPEPWKFEQKTNAIWPREDELTRYQHGLCLFYDKEEKDESS